MTSFPMFREPQISWTASHLTVSIAICAIGTNEAVHDIAAPDQTCQVKPSGMGPGRSPASLVSLPVLVSASTKQFFLLLLLTPNINSSARGGSGCSAISHGLTEPDQGRGGGGGWIRGKAGSKQEGAGRRDAGIPLPFKLSAPKGLEVTR